MRDNDFYASDEYESTKNFIHHMLRKMNFESLPRKMDPHKISVMIEFAGMSRMGLREVLDLDHPREICATVLRSARHQEHATWPRPAISGALR